MDECAAGCSSINVSKNSKKARLYLCPKQSCNTERSNVPKTNVILNHMVPKIALIYSFKLTIQCFFFYFEYKKNLNNLKCFVLTIF